jgi:hypothetical protein
MYLDLTYANIAEKRCHHSRRPKSRVKVGANSTTLTVLPRLRPALPCPDARSSRFGEGAFDKRLPPSTVVNLAKDTTTRGLRFREALAGAGCGRRK